MAVTGAAGALGHAVLAALDREEGLGRLVGLDDRPSPGTSGRAVLRSVDLRDPVLATVLAGVDVLVHCGTAAGPEREDDVAFARTVHGARNLLAAAARAGVRHVVYVSHGDVYGARADNPVPLHEDAPLRAAPAFPPAWRRVRVEEALAAWARAHPGVAVTVLRRATTLGPGLEDHVALFLDGPALPAVRGHEPPLQVVALDDVADAVAFVVRRRLAGTYNVAADGAVPLRQAARLVGRPVVTLPETVATIGLDLLWRWGAAPAPAGGLAYLMEPWVLATRALHAAGWAPRSTNRETLRAHAATRHGRVVIGRWRTRVRTLVAAAGCATGGGLGLLAAAVAYGRAGTRDARVRRGRARCRPHRRRRRTRTSRPPRCSRGPPTAWPSQPSCAGCSACHCS